MSDTDIKKLKGTHQLLFAIHFIVFESVFMFEAKESLLDLLLGVFVAELKCVWLMNCVTLRCVASLN
jgi:hypothetical protein